MRSGTLLSQFLRVFLPTVSLLFIVQYLGSRFTGTERNGPN